MAQFVRVRSVTRGARAPAPRGARARSPPDCFSSTLNARHSFARINERWKHVAENLTETIVYEATYVYRII